MHRLDVYVGQGRLGAGLQFLRFEQTGKGGKELLNPFPPLFGRTATRCPFSNERSFKTTSPYGFGLKRIEDSGSKSDGEYPLRTSQRLCVVKTLLRLFISSLPNQAAC